MYSFSIMYLYYTLIVVVGFFLHIAMYPIIPCMDPPNIFFASVMSCAYLNMNSILLGNLFSFYEQNSMKDCLYNDQWP